MPNRSNQVSEDMQDILSKMPSWMIRWGMTFILILIVISTTLTYFIKYPEIIEGRVLITTAEPPIKLASKANSSIKKINFTNSSYVEKGKVIIEFDHPTSLEEIHILTSSIRLLKDEIESEKPIKGHNFSVLTIGDQQNNLSQLQKTINEYNRYLARNDSKEKIKLIRQRIGFKKRYAMIIDSLEASFKKRLSYEKKSFSIKQMLYESEITPELEFLAEKIKYATTQDNLKEYKKSRIQNSMSIQDDRLQLFEVESQKWQMTSEYRESIYQLIHQLESYIEDWFQMNTIVAPESGYLNYLRNFQPNEYISTGDVLIAIVNDKVKFKATSYVPIMGFGKIKTGQKVRIKLDNYPFREFGYLIGEVNEISQIAHNEEYLTYISLENGLHTSYNKKLPFKPEISGTVEIITDDLRLMERIFNQFRSLNN